jgi:hypothetical protein
MELGFRIAPDNICAIDPQLWLGLAGKTDGATIAASPPLRSLGRVARSHQAAR